MGLKSLGFRDLHPPEIDRLREETKSALLRLWQPAVIGGAIPVALYVAAMIHGNGPEPTGVRMVVAFAFIFAGLLLLPAVSLLIMWDIVKQRRALRADLKNQRVECFSSTTEASGQTELEGTSGRDRLPIRSLEVLPDSSLVFLLNGAQPQHRVIAKVYEAVARPNDAPQYALPKELTSSLSDEVRERLVFERRRLTPAEIDELGQHARRLRRPSGGLVVFGIWCGMGIIAAVVAYREGDFSNWQREYLIPFLGLAAFTIWQSVRYARTLLASRKLAQDAASGWVIVIEQRDQSTGAQEVLPGSSAAWSVDGKPSDWRLVQRGKKQDQARV